LRIELERALLLQAWVRNHGRSRLELRSCHEGSRLGHVGLRWHLVRLLILDGWLCKLLVGDLGCLCILDGWLREGLVGLRSLRILDGWLRKLLVSDLGCLCILDGWLREGLVGNLRSLRVLHGWLCEGLVGLRSLRILHGWLRKLFVGDLGCLCIGNWGLSVLGLRICIFRLHGHASVCL